MGRKKKFIDKKDSSTFHVVHRSQQDKAKEGEEDASAFVLIPSVASKDKKSQEQTNHKSESSGKRRDHINSLGLPNDGYDYDQHLKSMGGGTFVSKSGKVQHFADEGTGGARGGGGKVSIPEEALPSGETLSRQLEAVTISEKVMDGDMRRALTVGMGGSGEESEDEGNWLDDDFVVQAAGADDEGGFDFDAHVARLMEASARETGLRQRTADDDLQTKGLARLKRPEDESDSDSDSRSDAGSDVGSDASSGEFDEALLEGLDIDPEAMNGRQEVGRADGGEDRAVLDRQFEATLAGYDSDEWGELEEDDQRLQGRWDPEQHEFANNCMDEFLEAKEDAAWVDGVERLPPEQRAIAVATLAVDPTNGNSGGGDDAQETGTAATASPGEDPNASGDTKENGPRLGSLKGLGLRGAGNRQREAAEHEDDDDDDQFDDIGVHNEYLRGKQEDKWDCETIVSTYSNLDNHPSVLGMGRKPRPSRRPRGFSPVEAGREGDGSDASPARLVTLSEKTGLPMGVLPERTFNDAGMVSLTAGRNAGEKRDTEESAEDKRLRKLRTKEEKRNKRVQKKQVKVAFTGEAKIVAHALANPEAQQNRSVFSYS